MLAGVGNVDKTESSADKEKRRGGDIVSWGFRTLPSKKIKNKMEKSMSCSATFPLDLRHLKSLYKHSSIDQNPVT